MRVEFTIPGRPRPWQRARSFGGRRFDSKEQRSLKTTIEHIASKAMKLGRHETFTGPVRLTVVCVFPRPGARVSKARGERVERCSLEVWQSGERFLMWARPDWDNLGKLPSDCIDGERHPLAPPPVLTDDGQVAIGTVEKWYAAKGEGAHTLVIVESL